MKCVCVYLLTASCIIICSHSVDAQEITSLPTPGVSVGGSITITSDFYNYKADPDTAQPGRRPPSLYRILFSPTINFSENFAIPFNINLSTPETNTTTPSTPHPTLAQYFENPANAFGFSSITPKLGWAELFVGSHSPTYSALSVGDQQIFGGGFDLKPGIVQLAASYGTSQRAIEPDTAKNIQGAYRRDMYMARIAFGNPKGSQVGVNLVRAKDDASSLHNTIASIIPAHIAEGDTSRSVLIPADTVRLRAEEGFVASTDFKLQFSDAFSFIGEAALSSFTRDQSSPEKVFSGNPLAFAQTTRTSTRADFAGTAALQLQQTAWGVKLSSLYMGAGFVPVGYSFVQPDRLEFSIAPNIHLFEDAFTLDGSVGERINNLSGTKAATTTQLIASVNLSAAISDAFNLSARYSNFGVRNDLTLDTLKVQTVSQSLSFDPTLTLRGATLTHIITASIGIDDYKDFNTISGVQASNNTRSVLGSYSIALNDIPLTVTIIGSYLENALPQPLGTVIIRSAGGRTSYSFLQGAITPSLSVTASGSTTGISPTDDQLFVKFDVRLRPTKFLEFTASAGNNQYQYGNPLSSKGKSFKETLVRLALTTRF